MDFTKWGPMTVVAVAVIVITVGAGAAITVIQPATLSFDEFFGDMKWVLAALGVGVPLGRGLHLGLKETPAPTPSTMLSSPIEGKASWLPAPKTADKQPSKADVMLDDETLTNEGDGERIKLTHLRGQHV